jgi:hypothetical protein
MPLTEKEVISRLWSDASTAEIYQIISHMVSVGRLVAFETTQAINGVDVKKKWLATPEQFKELEQRKKT